MQVSCFIKVLSVQMDLIRRLECQSISRQVLDVVKCLPVAPSSGLRSHHQSERNKFLKVHVSLYLSLCLFACRCIRRVELQESREQEVPPFMNRRGRAAP